MEEGGRRFFLPPIILQAGLGMRKKAFFANWQTIIATGILGTYIAFAIIAVMLVVFSRVLHVSLGVRSPSVLVTGYLLRRTRRVSHTLPLVPRRLQRLDGGD